VNAWGLADFLLDLSEDKYFSEAPLPTDRHIASLEEFEAGMNAYPPSALNTGFFSTPCVEEIRCDVDFASFLHPSHRDC